MLTLTMIVKNESRTLARTLASVKSFINKWVILDTGSTDGTQDLIRHELAGVPGELYEEPFIDFATSRNRALELAGQATEFVMWLDADDELVNGSALVEFLEREVERAEETYFIRISMGSGANSPRICFDSSRVTRARAGWRFKGVVHEVLMHPERQPPSRRIPDVFIRHDATADSAERSRLRWERDVVLLGQAAEADPNDTRTAYYLAKTLLWLGRNAQAEQAFNRRISLGGWCEEVFDSKMMLASLASTSSAENSWTKAQELYLDAHLFAPHRAEPLYDIALHYDRLGQHALTYVFARRGFDIPLPTKDTLFVDEEVYMWKLADLVATSAFWVGEFAVGEVAAHQALKFCPESQRQRTESNLGFYLNRDRSAPPFVWK